MGRRGEIETTSLQRIALHVQGRRIHARWGGGGRPRPGIPAVLVHGVGVSGRYLLPLACRLAAERPVLVPDLPGFGRSGAHRLGLGVGELAAALDGAMEAAGLRRAVLVGNSMGCQVITELAVRRQERAAALVLIAPTIDRQRRTVTQQLASFAAVALAEPPSLVALALADYLRAGPLRTAATFLRALSDPMERRLPRVTAPTLVLRGTGDRVAPLRWAREVTGLLPLGELRELPGLAHAPHWEAPALVAEEIEAYLLGLGSRGPPGHFDAPGDDLEAASPGPADQGG